MNITITYTDGVKSKLSCVIELYQPNNTEQLLIVDDVGHRMEVDKRIIKKIEVKP